MTGVHSVSDEDVLAWQGDCLVLPMFATRRLQGVARQVDEVSNGQLATALRRAGKQGHRNESLLLFDVEGISADRVLLIGCGRRREIDARRFRKIANHAAKQMTNVGADTLLSTLTLIEVKQRDTRWRVRQLVEAYERHHYRFDQLKQATDRNAPDMAPSEITHACGRGGTLDRARSGCEQAVAIAAGTALARDLANQPPNHCTPRSLAHTAELLARQHASLTATSLDEAAMQELGMGAMLAVSQGSDEPARLIVLEYRGSDDVSQSGDRQSDDAAPTRPIVLIGKGVTFDSGGLSLKTSASMEGMKYDMCGAAAVLGTIECCARLALPLHVVVIVAAVENMPGPGATRPGDVIKTLSGKTVEILNTDAEGRLVLGDALTYASRQYSPDVVIDVATLTGACVTALGRHVHGLWSNSRSLRRAMLTAGRRSHDQPWPMPLLEEYQSALDSDVADMRNIGGRTAGAITAACFLWRFARNLRWAHLDIAGTASGGPETQGASGRPVALLSQYLIDRASTDSN